jgi:hypothetical protein
MGRIDQAEAARARWDRRPLGRAAAPTNQADGGGKRPAWAGGGSRAGWP